MKFGFKRRNKKEWAGRRRGRGTNLIFTKVDIENDSKWNDIKFLIAFDEKVLNSFLIFFHAWYVPST